MNNNLTERVSEIRKGVGLPLSLIFNAHSQLAVIFHCHPLSEQFCHAVVYRKFFAVLFSFAFLFGSLESRADWVQLGADTDGESAADRSGYSVSLSSDGLTVAIGAPLNDGNGSNSGHVRIYNYDTGTSTWTQVGSDIDGELSGDISGCSVSMSSDGSTVAIGAH